MKVLLLFTVMICVAGCATVTVVDKNGNDTGVKFYTAEPYVLVTQTGNKDNPISVEVISLPDLANPYYAKYKPGYGSAKLDISLSGGILTTFGGSGESGDIAAILDAFTGGYKTIAETAKINLETRQARNNQDEEQSLTTGDFNQAGTSLLEISRNIKTGVDTATAVSVIDSSHKISKGIGKLLGDMRATGNLLLGADIELLERSRSVFVESITGYLKDLSDEGFMAITPENSEDEKKYNGLRRGWRDSVAVVLDNLKEQAAPAPKAPIFSLYKIVSDENGVMSFVEVPLP